VNALNDAFKVYGSTVVPAGDPPPFATSWFRTKDEQAAAIHKAFAGVADKFGNSDESMIAHYYLGVIAGDDGKMDEAEKQFKIVADNASRDYASLGKLSLAQIYKSNGKIEDGRKLIQSLIDNPTTFVSKEQATVEMARLLEQSKPEEARKLLEPLRTSVRPAVSQSAIGALGELMQPQQQPQK
jgi:lipopolysaccharide biosynthesis regulator YciM